jgi:sugar/nucleoside kinase (ribokinase family)
LDGVGVEHTLFATDAPTGECIVLVTPDGKRTMIPSTGANARIGRTLALSALREGLSEHSGHVHLSGYLPYHDDQIAKAAVTSAKELGATCSIDTASTPQLREYRERLLTIVPVLDVLIGSLPELAVLAGQDAHVDATSEAIVDGLRQRCGVRGVVVLKRGPDGAYVDEAGRGTHVPAHDGKVIDTTGAGDAMAAGFLAAWTSGASAPEALQAGAAAAAQAVSTLGAHPASSLNEGPDAS